MDIKLTLKNARKLAGKTQRQSASCIGVCVDTYRAIEADPEKATIYQAKALAEFFGFPYDQIFFLSAST